MTKSPEPEFEYRERTGGRTMTRRKLSREDIEATREIEAIVGDKLQYIERMVNEFGLGRVYAAASFIMSEWGVAEYSGDEMKAWVEGLDAVGLATLWLVARQTTECGKEAVQ